MIEISFDDLLEAVPDAVLIVDQAGLMRRVNAQTETLFGYARGELANQPVEMLLPSRVRTDHVRHRETYFAHARTRPMGSGLALYGRRKDGSEFPVEVSLSPIKLVSPLLVVSTIRDVTARRDVEQRLRAAAAELSRSNTELEQFAYVASHDLQEPLRMVAAYTQLLARRYAGRLDADADEFIHFAVDGAQRMQELIRDLLEYSRAGSRTLRLQAVDVGVVVDDLVHDLGAFVDGASLAVTRDPLPVITADAAQIRLVLQNLIANGLKFHRPGETAAVHVSAHESGRRWWFHIRDNGIGIEPQYRERIFVIFQRLHTHSDYPGTGIGLAICKRIVERHGGTIGVISEPGKGTTFSFSVPCTPVALETDT
ncbi:MAG: hypothetical protein NVSMB2_06970 [Chloroflexota bacterium]